MKRRRHSRAAWERSTIRKSAAQLRAGRGTARNRVRAELRVTQLLTRAV